MKTNLKSANLKQEYAEQNIRRKADDNGILFEDNAHAVAVKIELRRKVLELKPFTSYDVWIIEGIKEVKGRCEEYIVIHAMTLSNLTVITDKSNILKQTPIGDSFRYLNFNLLRKTKDDKDFFVIK